MQLHCEGSGLRRACCTAGAPAPGIQIRGPSRGRACCTAFLKGGGGVHAAQPWPLGLTKLRAHSCRGKAPNRRMQSTAVVRTFGVHAAQPRLWPSGWSIRPNKEVCSTNPPSVHAAQLRLLRGGGGKGPSPPRISPVPLRAIATRWNGPSACMLHSPAPASGGISGPFPGVPPGPPRHMHCPFSYTPGSLPELLRSVWRLKAPSCCCLRSSRLRPRPNLRRDLSMRLTSNSGNNA